jgi:hypothetical protein
MSQTETAGAGPAKLSADKLREIINRWSRAGFFRVPNMGHRITVNQIVDHASYTVRLWSEYEQRSVGRSSKPYQGGPVDDSGTRPDPWEIAVRRPTEFEDRTEKLPVPHTEQVETCPSCHGVGQVTCGTCQGTGQVNCPFCQGKGYRERMETRTEPGPGGVQQLRTVPVRDNCTCFNGRVNCSACAGRGRVQCSPCAGSGQVRTFDLLTVQFRVEERCEVVNTTEVPPELLRASSGKVRAVEDGERVETFPGVRPEVDEKAHALLRQSQAAHGDTRLLFQRLRIEEVGVHEVRYWYGGPPLRHLWVYGDEERVHAPGAPWSRGRVAALVGGVLAAVVAVLLVLFRILPH